MFDSTDPNDAYAYSNPDRVYIRYRIRNRTNKHGLTQILIQVQQYIYRSIGEYKNVINDIPTNIWIKPTHWNKKKNEVKYADPESEYKNNKIGKIRAAVEMYVKSKGQQEPDQVYTEGFDMSRLRELFPPAKGRRKSLVEYMNDYVEHRKMQRTPRGTVKEFITCKNRVKAFDEWRKRSTFFEDLTILWSNEFENYLRNFAEHGKGNKGYTDGTIHKTYTILITVLYYYYEVRDEMRLNLTDKFQSKSFKRGSKSENKAVYLNSKQLMALYRHDFKNPRLNRAKTIFCLQCFTAMRHGDIHLLRPDHFEEGRLEFMPRKTIRHKVEVGQPLNRYAKEILESFAYDTSELKLSNQKYNDALHDMFKEMRKEYPKLKYKDYTSHNARDTFITHAVQAKTDWKTILRWAGQSSYTVMDRYIAQSNEYEEEQMNKVFS